MGDLDNVRYWCGMDWSERRREKRVLRLCCVAGISELDALQDVFRRTRLELNLPRSYEFHAHACPEDWQYRLLKAVSDASIGLRTSAILREDDAEAVRQSAAEELVRLGLSVFADFLRDARMAEVACDEDLEGQKRQRPFITEGKKLYRSRWPGEKCKIHFCPSKTSELIQMADVIVFGLGRLHLGMVDHDELRGLLGGLRADPQNRIWEETEERDD